MQPIHIVVTIFLSWPLLKLTTITTLSELFSVHNQPILAHFSFRFTQNFGVLGILDRLHNTDEGFRHSKAYERHILLLGLSPAKELFPDTSKGKDLPCTPVHCQ